MENYEIQLFYDPARMGVKFIQDVYAKMGLSCPFKEEISKPFFVDEKTKRQTAVTIFNTNQKKKVLDLTERVIDMPNTRIEITSNSK